MKRIPQIKSVMTPCPDSVDADAPVSQALGGAAIRITACCNEGRADRVQLSEAVPPLLAIDRD